MRLERGSTSYLLAWIAAAPALLAGCGLETAEDAEPSRIDPPTWEELENATYRDVEGIDEIPMRHGLWEGEPYVAEGAARPRAGLVEEMHLTGDVDGDGVDDAVVFVWTSGGGSGTYLSAALVARRGDGVEHVATSPIGDRVQLRGVSLDEGVVAIDVVQAGESDAMCCPGELATVRLSHDGDDWQSVTEATGRLTLDLLEGTEWRLTHLDLGEPVTEGIEPTMTIAEGRIAGLAGCNRYSGAVSGTSELPGQIAIGPVAVTKMMCPPPQMEVEDRFLASLEASRTFGYWSGHLSLSHSGPEGSGTLLFLPLEEEIPEESGESEESSPSSERS